MIVAKVLRYFKKHGYSFDMFMAIFGVYIMSIGLTLAGVILFFDAHQVDNEIIFVISFISCFLSIFLEFIRVSPDKNFLERIFSDKDMFLLVFCASSATALLITSNFYKIFNFLLSIKLYYFI